MTTTPGWKLVSKADGHEIEIGEQAVTFRGEKAVVTGWEAPLHPASTGRVYIKFDIFHGWEHGYFPSVVDAVFVKAD